ncbi:GAF domain-containing protein [Nocardioides zeae]
MSPRRRPIAELVGGDELPRVLALLELVTSESDLDEALNAIIETACDLTGAAYGVLAVLDAEGRMRDFHIHGLQDAEVDAMGELPEGRGLLGRLLSSCRPLRLDQVSGRPDAEELPPGHPEIDRFLGVPIQHAGRSLGTVFLGDRPGHPPFTSTDEQVLEWLAERAAQVLALAEARARAERREEWLRVFQRSVELLEPPSTAASRSRTSPSWWAGCSRPAPSWSPTSSTTTSSSSPRTPRRSCRASWATSRPCASGWRPARRCTPR